MFTLPDPEDKEHRSESSRSVFSYCYEHLVLTLSFFLSNLQHILVFELHFLVASCDSYSLMLSFQVFQGRHFGVQTMTLRSWNTYDLARGHMSNSCSPVVSSPGVIAVFPAMEDRLRIRRSNITKSGARVEQAFTQSKQRPVSPYSAFVSSDSQLL